MICANEQTKVKYNYCFEHGKVKLWNPTCRPFKITEEEFNKDYYIVDKWLKL